MLYTYYFHQNKSPCLKTFKCDPPISSFWSFTQFSNVCIDMTSLKEKAELTCMGFLIESLFSQRLLFACLSFMNEKIGFNPSSLVNFQSCISTNGMKTQTLNSPIWLFVCSNKTQEVNSLFNFNSEIIMHFRKERKCLDLHVCLWDFMDIQDKINVLSHLQDKYIKRGNKHIYAYGCILNYFNRVQPCATLNTVAQQVPQGNLKQINM